MVRDLAVLLAVPAGSALSLSTMAALRVCLSRDVLRLSRGRICRQRRLLHWRSPIRFAVVAVSKASWLPRLRVSSLLADAAEFTGTCVRFAERMFAWRSDTVFQAPGSP